MTAPLNADSLILAFFSPSRSYAPLTVACHALSLRAGFEIITAHSPRTTTRCWRHTAKASAIPPRRSHSQVVEPKALDGFMRQSKSQRHRVDRHEAASVYCKPPPVLLQSSPAAFFGGSSPPHNPARPSHRTTLCWSFGCLVQGRCSFSDLSIFPLSPGSSLLLLLLLLLRLHGQMHLRTSRPLPLVLLPAVSSKTNPSCRSFFGS